MAGGNKLSSSLEDYLETIYLIVREHGSARSKDITRRLPVTPASVTEALRALEARGLVNYVPYSLITLTPAGEARAREVLHRHETLRDFFVEVLGVDPQTADSGACRIEHVISDEILESMITYTSTVRQASRDGATVAPPDRHDRREKARGQSARPSAAGGPAQAVRDLDTRTEPPSPTTRRPAR